MTPNIAYIAKKSSRKNETRPHEKENSNSTHRSDYYREHPSDSYSDEDSPSSRRRNYKRSEQQLNERRGKIESRNLGWRAAVRDAKYEPSQKRQKRGRR